MVTLPQKLTTLLNDPNVNEEDKPMIKELRKIVRQKSSMPTDLLKYRFVFWKYFNLREWSAPNLVLVSHFMSHEPVTGLGTINRIIRMPVQVVNFVTGASFKPFKLTPNTNFLVAAYCKYFVKRDLNMLLTRLRNEDQLISAEEDLSKLSPALLAQICLERGINIEQSVAKQIEDLKLWLSISNLRNVPNSLLIYSRLKDYYDDGQFEIDDDETTEEILRRVSTQLRHQNCVE